MSSAQQLEAGVEALGLSLDTGQLEQLQTYLVLLKKWNRVYNLTAVRDEAEMVTHHLLDSLALLPFLDTESLLDVGSGPGLPGIPLAIARPALAVTVLDSNDKKCAFMRQAVTELKLRNVSVCLQRIEGWIAPSSFQTVTSRAFAELADFASWCAHVLAPGGRLLAMKGQFPADEIERLPAAFEVKRVERLNIPGLEAERHLLWIGRKNESQMDVQE